MTDKIDSAYCSETGDFCKYLERTIKTIRNAKKEVFDDMDKFLQEADKRLPMGLMVSRGINPFKDMKPTYNELKEKHLQD